jgi:DNA ligase-associated metallophosphoesterase
LIVRIRDTSFMLLSERAVFWIDERVLFCSDLHWGRESFLQTKGFAVPEVSFEKESKLLVELSRGMEAKELWILGDFIHHPQGVTEEIRSGLRAWTNELKLPVTLIPGNHDRGISSWIRDSGIDVAGEALVRKDFEFRHEGEGAPGHYVWNGHLHPAVRIPQLLGHKKLPCFWIRRDVGYLPAFSRLAGGAEIEPHRAGDRVFAVANDEVIDLSVG